MAAVGSRFGLSALERVRLGTDGEGWCKRAGACFPLRVGVAGHLDPFHVNRALLSCFDEPAMGRQLVEVVNDGGKEGAAALLEAAVDMGLPPRVGSGYEPPRASGARAASEVRYAAAVDSGMTGAGW